jgi:hypothetical protein
MAAAFGKIFEVSLARELFDLRGANVLLVSVALWEGGLPIEVLPVDGLLEIALGEENHAWELSKMPSVPDDQHSIPSNA